MSLKNSLNTPVAIAAIILCIVCIYIQLKNWWIRKGRYIRLAISLPGPSILSSISDTLQLIYHPKEMLQQITQYAKSYKTPCHLWLGPDLFVVLTKPQDYEAIFGSMNGIYKGPNIELWKSFVGEGIIPISGPTHVVRRKAIVPMLNNKSLSMYMESFKNHSVNLVEVLEKKTDMGRFNVKPILTRYFTDIMLETIMGIPGTTHQGGHENLIYWQEKMFSLILERMTKPWLRWDWLFSLSDNGRQQKIGEKFLRDFTQTTMEYKKWEYNYMKHNVDSTNKRQGLAILEQLIEYTQHSNNISNDELRDDIFNIYIAGQDTLTEVACFLLLMLGMHQDVQDKVRKEIADVIGDSAIDELYLSKLQYTETVIYETLRLFPPGTIVVRELTGDIKLESCTLPEGCLVMMLRLLTHRNPALWNDPNKFIPERFAPNNSVGRHRFSFIPFGVGIKGCLGQKYAMLSLKTLLVNLLRNLRLTALGCVQDVKLISDITLRARDGYDLSISCI